MSPLLFSAVISPALSATARLFAGRKRFLQWFGVDYWKADDRHLDAGAAMAGILWGDFLPLTSLSHNCTFCEFVAGLTCTTKIHILTSQACSSLYPSRGSNFDCGEWVSNTVVCLTVMLLRGKMLMQDDEGGIVRERTS